MITAVSARPGVVSRGVAALAGLVLTLAALTACSSPAPGPPDDATPTASLAAPQAASPTQTPLSVTPDPQLRVQRTQVCVAALPRDVRIGQTMLVTTYDLPRVTGWLDDGLIAGVLANGQLTAQSAAAYRDATRNLRYGALLASDEEGGEVQRYAALVGRIPSARTQAATMTPTEVRRLYRGLGSRLADWGVDLVLAPVADVGHGPGIGSRAYGSDEDTVGRYARAAARGLADAGQIPVVKHFPGHGSASGDSHDQRVVGPGIEQLRAVDLVAIKRVLAGEPTAAVMVGHTTIPGYTDAPSSQSAKAIDGLLRDELGFEGLVVSDALGMAASGEEDQGQALVGFLVAGGDLGIIGPYGSVQGRRAVRAALRSGELTEQRLNEAAGRVLAAKGIDPCDVVGGPDPEAHVEPGQPDPPVVNPTTE